MPGEHAWLRDNTYSEPINCAESHLGNHRRIEMFCSGREETRRLVLVVERKAESFRVEKNCLFGLAFGAEKLNLRLLNT